jgi:hypothetical protein
LSLAGIRIAESVRRHPIRISEPVEHYLTSSLAPKLVAPVLFQE